MLPSPFAWFIVMLMIFVGILVGLLSAFSWGRSFVGAAMRLTRFQFLVIAAVLAASLVSFVLFVSFGSALSLVWRCPTFLQFILMMFLCLVCSRARLVLGCFGSGQAKDKKLSGKRVLRYLLICCKVFLPIQVCGTCAAAYVEDFHKVASFAAAACEKAFSWLFTIVICEFFVWLGTLGDHVESARVRITLQCDTEKGFIAMLAMALLVCFSTGSGMSFLATFWKDIGHVLGLRIVGLGCGGCQGLSVAWLAQATPWVDVAIVPFRFLKNLEFLVVLFALVRNMSFVMCDKLVQATDELQQQAAAALATMTLSPRWGPRLACQTQATPRVDEAEVSIASSGLMGSGTKKMKAPSPAFPEFIDSDADPCCPVQWSLSMCHGAGVVGGAKARGSCG